MLNFPIPLADSSIASLANEVAGEGSGEDVSFGNVKKVTVADDAERLALTTAKVALGDYVYVTSTDTTYIVDDLSALGTEIAFYNFRQEASSTITPIGLGVSASGSSKKASREDHVHQMPSKSDIGLGNVDNTSDANKPVSNAQAAAIAAKEPLLGNPTADGQVLASTAAGVRSWVTPSSGSGGSATPLSDATPSALGTASAGTSANASRADHIHAMPSKSDVGLGNVDNTTDANKPVSSAQASADAAVLASAKIYADTVGTAATTTASSDATTKANAAQAAAIAAAATDATTKAAAREPALGNPTADGQVLASTAAGARSWVTPSSSAAGATGGRNRIINGDMRIDQRNSGAAQTFAAGGALAYCVDRFYGYCTGANITGQRVTTNARSHYVFTGAASNTAVGFGQRIEAANCYDLAGSTATLSAKLSSSSLTSITWTAYYATTADTFGPLAAPARTQIATGAFTISSTETTYSAQIAIPPAATTGIEIVFTTGALLASQTLTIGDVQLEPGSVATAFERRFCGDEFVRCERYYAVFPAGNTAYATSGGGTLGLVVAYPVNMRAAPTIFVATTSNYDVGTAVATNVTDKGAYIYTACSVTGPVAFQASVTVSAEL